MKVSGVTITDDQVQAGLAAMRGEFFALWVAQALEAAGVPWLHGKGSLTGPQPMPAYRAADRLLQRERKAGRIQHIGGGRWKLAAPIEGIEAMRERLGEGRDA